MKDLATYHSLRSQLHFGNRRLYIAVIVIQRRQGVKETDDKITGLLQLMAC